MDRILINGFGRIGRNLFKILIKDSFFKNIDIDINEPFMSIENIVYLLRYDSIYGRFDDFLITYEGNTIILSKKNYTKKCNIFKFEELIFFESPTRNYLLIDCSSQKNDINYYNNIENKFYKILVTHWVDGIPYFVNGLSRDKKTLYDGSTISMGICDIVGIGTVINRFNKYCIDEINIVTMHPWLSYQNVLDGQPRDVIHKNSPNLQIGRESINSIIPKKSSLNNIMEHIWGKKCSNISVMTYRVPTDIVTCCDLKIKFKNQYFSKDRIVELLTCDFIELCSDAMVSRDFINSKINCSVDINWIKIFKNTVHLTLWYNNEIGYCNNICSTLKMIWRSK